MGINPFFYIIHQIDNDALWYSFGHSNSSTPNDNEIKNELMFSTKVTQIGWIFGQKIRDKKTKLFFSLPNVLTI